MAMMVSEELTCRTSRQDFGGTGGLSIALQSLTDSTHWPRFACGISEGQPESQAVQAALTAAASGLASMDISSEVRPDGQCFLPVALFN